MFFADLALSKRLERAEGRACAEFAEAQRLVRPESGAEWREIGGAYAVYNGAYSPVTQSFGLGLYEELTEDTLDEIEQFFTERGAAVCHEVSPFAGVNALALLCARGYKPIEISHVLWQPVVKQETPSGIAVRVAGEDEAELWARTNARGWAQDNTEIYEFLLSMSALFAARSGSLSFLAEMDGVAGAAGALSVHGGVALFAGASTVPEMRRRGLQGALLAARMRYAFEHGCDLAMMVTEAGSESQRNAERTGFRVAYTRMKWQLQH